MMRNLIAGFFSVILSLSCLGQTITEMEYFFDDDPGYGMATSVTITPGSVVNQSFSAPTGLPLTTGFHDLFVRVRGTGGVLTISVIGGTFEVGEIVTGGTSGATGSILAAFPDRLEVSTTGTFTATETLTGGTSGATATLTSFTAHWSVPESRLVYVDPTGAGTVLVEELEYFFDTDPGYDMGTSFTAFTAASVVNEMTNAPTTGLSIGFHTLYVRAKAVGGVWGMPESRLVYVDDTGSGVFMIEDIEYFFDTDPGYDMATKFTAFTPAGIINQMENLPTSSLSVGFHTLFIRAKTVGDTWGVPESRLVYVDPSGAGMIQVEELEYFFDQDPGYDMGTKFTAFTAAQVVNQLENLPTSSLSTGFHTLYVRAKSAGNVWGLPESRLVYVDPSGAANVNITALEYFFDVDPGVGMATSVPITTPGFNVTEMFDILAADVPLGTHTLVVRAQNANGVWGMIETKSITAEKDNALNFDGTDDFVTVTDAASLDLTTSGTLTAWINPSAYPAAGNCSTILAKSWGVGGQAQNSPYHLMLCDSRELRFSIGDDTNSQAVTSGSPILTDEWTHIAVTWNGSNVTMYVNGVAISTETQTITPFASTEDLIVGSVDGIAGFWNGDLDEVSVWDVSITETEIQTLLEDGLMGSESNLAGYYEFDEGDADIDNTGITSLPDATANTNDGTLNNFALNGTSSNWVGKGGGAGEDIPGEPFGLFVTDVSDTQIDLSWQDRSYNETGFIIERSDGNNTSFAQIGTVGTNVTSYSDNSVTVDNGYFYRVRATNASGDSAPTDEQFGSTIPQPGNALQFDGTDDYVDVGTIGLDFTSSPFTIEFWAKRDANDVSGDWVINVGEEPSSSGESIHAGFTATNQFSFDFKGDALTSDGSFTDLEWHHWVVIYEPDAAADGDDRRIYLDGNLLKEDDPAGSFTGSSYLKIGQAFDSEFFGGIVDEVRVWDDIRTESEITTFINSTLVGNEANLVAYYRLDQDEITDIIVPDRSGNGSDGTWVDGGGGVTSPQWVVSGSLSADLTAPTVVVQNISVSLDAMGMVSITPAEIDNGSTDDVSATADLTLSLDVTDFTCADIGANTVTLTVVDEAGNSASATATVTIVDDIAPMVVASDFTITLDASDQAVVQTTDIDGGSTDNCSFTLSLDVDTFTRAEIGDNTVTLTAIDAGGNSVSATAIVTVLDNNTPPTVTTQNITVALDATGNITITPDQVDNGTTDDFTAVGDLAFALDVSMFDCTDLGDNTVTLTVTDELSASASATAVVTVVDDLLPVLLVQDVTVMLDATDMAVITTADIDNGTSDNCGFTLSLDVDTFGKTEVGANTVTLSATDPSGNVGSAQATVTVLDNNSAPDISFVFYIEENSENGTLLGRIVAEDMEMDPVSFSIILGNAGDAFSVGATSGDIRVNASEALDFETTPVFNLMVEANDGNGDIALVSITINLIDIIDENPLSVGELAEVEVFPNPASDELHIDLKIVSAREVEVQMYTLSGSLILTPDRIVRQASQIHLDLEGISSGIYLLKVKTESEVITKNVLVR